MADNALKLCAELCIVGTVLVSLGLKVANVGVGSQFSVAFWSSLVAVSYVTLGLLPVIVSCMCKLCRIAPRFKLARSLIAARPWVWIMRVLEPGCDEALAVVHRPTTVLRRIALTCCWTQMNCVHLHLRYIASASRANTIGILFERISRKSGGGQ